MKIHKLIILPAFALLVIVGGAVAGMALTRGGGPSLGTSVTSGFEVLKPIPELAARSDIVVRGTVVSVVEEARQLPKRKNPPGESRPEPDRYRVIQTFQVRVTEYLKGSGPEVIPVFGNRPLGAPDPREKPELREGEEYVLFLFSTAGATFWGNGYIVMGPTQGYWRVNGEGVSRPLGLQIAMPMQELRDRVSPADN